MTLDEVFRNDWARVLGALARRFNDLDLAEECAQDAFERAARSWQRTGPPDNPGAWLMRVAHNRAVDRLRARRATGELSETASVQDDVARDDFPDTDERLRLLLMCAHPALSPESRLPLMLRCVTGLTVAQIAAAFFVPASAIAQRLVRAKRKIKSSGITFDVDPQHVAGRLESVRAAIYLLFNEGYSSSAADAPSHAELLAEALYLAQLLYRLYPNDPENAGLYALLLLHRCRMPARFDECGRAIPLPMQDPQRYDRPMFQEAARILFAAFSQRRPGRYQIEAAISSLHTQGAFCSRPDWKQIAELYDRLAAINPSPVVDINRAVAAANAGDAQRGLQLLGPVLESGLLDAYAPLHVAHADLLERTGQGSRAESAWQLALLHAVNPAQRAEIARRAAAVSASS